MSNRNLASNQLRLQGSIWYSAAEPHINDKFEPAFSSKHYQSIITLILQRLTISYGDQSIFGQRNY